MSNAKRIQEQRKSGGSKAKTKKTKAKKKAAAKMRWMLLSFDAEWVTRGDENEVLSYQIWCRCGDQTWHHVKVLEPGQRYTLTQVVMQGVELGMRAGKMRARPGRVYMVAHWTLADLSSLANLDEIRTEFDSVRKSFVTVGKPYLARYSNKNNNKYEIEVVLRDTILLAPESHRPLARIGQLIGFEKLDIHPRYKENMDALLRDDPDRFHEYALRDAEISGEYILKIREFAHQLYGEEEFPLAIGTMAMKYALAYWERLEIDHHAVLGTEEVVRKKAFSWGGRTVVRDVKETEPLAIRQLFDDHANLAYWGGHNECFYFGATPESNYTDFDLASAYATCMATLGMIRWDEMRATTDIADFTPEVVGCAMIAFEFPESVAYPPLPVSVESGLIFPRRGETHATAPEIYLAVSLGADIKIVAGCVAPMDFSCRPFEEIAKEVGRLREIYKAEDNMLMDKLIKTVGNSVYGKVAQGINPKRVYSSRSGRMEDLKNSKITNPFIASAITGFIRAVLGEILNALPDDCLVASVTTDGFLADATDGMIETATSGPLCRIYAETRQRLPGGSEVLEKKCKATQVLTWRTRGVVGLEYADPEIQAKELLLAKAGIKIESWDRFEQADAIENMFIDRRFGEQTCYARLRGLRQLCEQGGDLVSLDRSIRHTMDFDWKRRVAEIGEQPINGKPHVCFTTGPVEDAREFEETRAKWKEFYARFARPLKTPEDVADFQEFCAIKKSTGLQLPGHLAALYTARKMVLIALARYEWGLATNLKNGEVAELFTGAGYKTTTREVENARRDGARLFEQCVAETPAVREFLDWVSSEFPDFDETGPLAG